MAGRCRTTGHSGVGSHVRRPGDSRRTEAIGASSLWAVGQDAVFDQKQIDFMLKDTPLRRLTTAEDIGRAVVWFSSPHAARQVTGQLISVSGGYTMP
jgi:2-hydroxycyclohexanecarboxyl-CoA dehydrogenase